MLMQLECLRNCLEVDYAIKEDTTRIDNLVQYVSLQEHKRQWIKHIPVVHFEDESYCMACSLGDRQIAEPEYPYKTPAERPWSPTHDAGQRDGVPH